MKLLMCYLQDSIRIFYSWAIDIECDIWIFGNFCTPAISQCSGCKDRPARPGCLYRVIHKSLRDFRPLRYSSRDGHAEGERVNRGRDTPSFCPTLQVLDMLTSEGSWQKFLVHARQSRPMAPAGLFVSQRTGSHSAGISCTTHELFCP